MRRGALATALGAAVAVAACGYGFSQRFVAKNGADRVHVRPFENRSSERDLGALVTAALRSELARRGAQAGEGAAAVIDGEARATSAAPTSENAAASGAAVAPTWTIGIEVHARLLGPDGKPVAERTVRRDASFLGGADALETEGRRALAIRQLAADAAAEVLRGFER